MASLRQHIRILDINPPSTTASVSLQQAQHGRWLGVAVALAIVFVLTLAAAPVAQAQTFRVIYNFTGGLDGGYPEAGLTMDRAGSVYGTTVYGGRSEQGTVFKLYKPSSSWILSPLYSFHGNDGGGPTASVTLDQDSSLYGTTQSGGRSQGCGNVFELKPSPSAPSSVLSSWNEIVLLQFSGSPTDGCVPYANVIFDQSGNIYGTTIDGGTYDEGTVFELTHSGSGWVDSVLYSFQGGSDGGNPYCSLVFDGSGNLYGTTAQWGAYGRGTVFELIHSGSVWSERILYNFEDENDGGYPYAGLIFDQLGNLYGTAQSGGSDGGGTVFELTPSGGTWAFSVLYSFSAFATPNAIVRDAVGNLYGTTHYGGPYSTGSVFELSRPHGAWVFADLYDFTGGSDGGYPDGGVTLGTNGNLYGTAPLGGAYRDGVVWEITP